MTSIPTLEPSQTQPIQSRIELMSVIESRAQLRHVRLGTLLITAGLVSEKAVSVALAVQRSGKTTRIGDLLIAMGETTAEQIEAAVHDFTAPPLVDLSSYAVNKEAAACISARVAERFGVIPLDIFNNTLCVVTRRQLSDEDIHLLAHAANCKEVFILSPLQKDLFIQQFRRGNFLLDTVLFPDEDPNDISVADGAAIDADQGEPSLRLMLSQALAYGASDIHLHPDVSGGATVFFRVNGVLTRFFEWSPESVDKSIRQLEAQAGLGLRRPNEAREGRLSLRHNGLPIDLRISIIPSAAGLSTVLRVLDPRKFPTEVSQLLLSPAQTAWLDDLIERPHGLFLVTGPTGAGKTTTLYTMLKQLQSKGGRHLATAEDPVEFRLPGINQFDTSNFTETLKLLLRHDPDVIMVGELREIDGAITAVNAALTGHLVLSTIHSKDAVSAVHRLLGLGVPPALISACFNGALSQRLVRLTCSVCSGEGCERCYQTGYYGRQLVAELIKPRDTFDHAVRADSSYQDIANHIEYVDGLTLDEAIIALAEHKLTDWAEVRSLVSNPSKLPLR